VSGYLSPSLSLAAKSVALHPSFLPKHWSVGISWSLTITLTLSLPRKSYVSSKRTVEDGPSGRYWSTASPPKYWASKLRLASFVQNIIYFGCSEPAVPSRLFFFGFSLSFSYSPSDLPCWPAFLAYSPVHWLRRVKRSFLISLVDTFLSDSFYSSLLYILVTFLLISWQVSNMDSTFGRESFKSTLSV